MVSWKIKNNNIREFMAELLGTCTLVVSDHLEISAEWSRNHIETFHWSE